MQATVVGSGRRYRASELLSEDELGTLWRGVDDRSGAAVCVRFLGERLTSDPTALQRASTQLRRLQWRSSDSPLARVLEHDLRPLGARASFVVSEASGVTLARRIDDGGALSVPAALRVVAAVADGLATAHAQWVYHGALTPSSVLLGDDGAVAVVDVGLGELLDDPDHRGPRSANLADQGAVDVFAVAVLLEQLVIGHRPPAPGGRARGAPVVGGGAPVRGDAPDAAGAVAAPTAPARHGPPGDDARPSRRGARARGVRTGRAARRRSPRPRRLRRLGSSPRT